MSKPIRLTSLAKNDLAGILEYLNHKWNALVAANFIIAVEDCLSTISQNPDAFPFHIKDKNLKKCVVTKHNTIYFREEKLAIVVIRIYDTRQDPSKLKLF